VIPRRRPHSRRCSRRRSSNLFAELMSAVKVASLGQISGALYEVGGIYRRNM
jgi:methylmalonyl-CoA mutase